MSNYIQVEIGGRLRGLKFNQLSLEEYTKHVRIGTASAIYATFFAGLMGNCYVKNEEPDFTFEEVCDWVDELYAKQIPNIIENVCDVWAETFVYKEWLKGFQEKLRSILTPDEEPKPKKKMK